MLRLTLFVLLLSSMTATGTIMGKACKSSAECDAITFCHVGEGSAGATCDSCAECHDNTEAVEGTCPKKCEKMAALGRKQFKTEEGAEGAETGEAELSSLEKEALAEHEGHPETHGKSVEGHPVGDHELDEHNIPIGKDHGVEGSESVEGTGDHDEHNEHNIPIGKDHGVEGPEKVCKKNADCSKTQFCYVQPSDHTSKKTEPATCEQCSMCHKDAYSADGKCPTYCLAAAKTDRELFKKQETDSILKESAKHLEALRNMFTCKTHADCNAKDTHSFCHNLVSDHNNQTVALVCSKCGNCVADSDGVGGKCFKQCGFTGAADKICDSHHACGKDSFCTSPGLFGDDSVEPKNQEEHDKIMKVAKAKGILESRCSPCSECKEHGDGLGGKCPAHCDYTMGQDEL